MNKLTWALVGILLLGACATHQAQQTGQQQASAQLQSLEKYHQENSYAFECNTAGFAPTSFSWDFGDGTTRTTLYKGVAHTYFKSGTYNVTCTAADDLINQTSSMLVTVTMPETDIPVYNSTENGIGNATAASNISDDLGMFELLSDTAPNATAQQNITTPQSTYPSTAQQPAQQDATANGFDIFNTDSYNSQGYTQQDYTPTSTGTDTNTSNASDNSSADSTDINGIGSIQPSDNATNGTNGTSTTNTTDVDATNTTSNSSTPLNTTAVNTTNVTTTAAGNSTSNSTQDQTANSTAADTNTTANITTMASPNDITIPLAEQRLKIGKIRKLRIKR